MSTTSSSGHARSPEDNLVDGRDLGRTSSGTAPKQVRLADEARAVYLALADEQPERFGWIAGLNVLILEVGLTPREVVNFRAPRDIRQLQGPDGSTTWAITLDGWGPADPRAVAADELVGLARLSAMDLNAAALSSKLRSVQRVVTARLGHHRGRGHQVTLSALAQWRRERVHELALATDLDGCPSTHALRRLRQLRPQSAMARVMSPLLLANVDERDAQLWACLPDVNAAFDAIASDHRFDTAGALFLADPVDAAAKAAVHRIADRLGTLTADPSVWQPVTADTWAHAVGGPPA